MKLLKLVMFSLLMTFFSQAYSAAVPAVVAQAQVPAQPVVAAQGAQAPVARTSRELTVKQLAFGCALPVLAAYVIATNLQDDVAELPKDIWVCVSFLGRECADVQLLKLIGARGVKLGIGAVSLGFCYQVGKSFLKKSVAKCRRVGKDLMNLINED